MIKVSHLLGFSSHQKDLNFANICINGHDNRLYIDPLLIGIANDQMAIKCYELIEDYFGTVFEQFEQGSSFSSTTVFSNFTENNSVRLGKTAFESNSNGKGLTPEMLYNIFKTLHSHNLVKRGLVKDIMDPVLYVRGLHEDRMSDIVLAVIYPLLNKYTLEIASHSSNKLNYKEVAGFEWCINSHSWRPTTFKQLIDSNGEELTLVPKHFLTGSYVYKANSFIMGHLVKHEQEQRKKFLQQLGEESPKVGTLKQIYTELKDTYGVGKEFAINFTLQHPELIERYRQQRRHGAKGTYDGKLTDQQLTYIIELPYKLEVI